MGMSGRFVMGAFALFMIWTMVRAWRTGRIASGALWRFDIDDNPFMFALTMATHAFLVAMFLWVAAGLTPHSFLDLFGLGWFDDLHNDLRHVPRRA
jgi:hypothetical protein